MLIAMYMSHRHVEKITNTFSETPTMLFKDNREDAAAHRKELQDLVRSIRDPR